MSVLGEVLEAWIPRGLRYDGDLKFVTKKRYEDLVVQWSEERRKVVRDLKEFGDEKTRQTAEQRCATLHDWFIEVWEFETTASGPGTKMFLLLERVWKGWWSREEGPTEYGMRRE